MIAERVQFKGRKDEWELQFELREDSVFLQVHSEQTMETYEAEMTAQRILDDKNFSFFFESPKELFKFLEASYNELTILLDGTVMFVMGMPVGKIVKNIQFRIPTVKRELDQSLVVQRKFKQLEKSIETLRQENQELLMRSTGQEQAMTALKQEVAALQRALAQKDEVLGSIFSQLGELNKWKEEKDKKFEGLACSKRRFLADQANSHNLKFTCVGGSRFRKNCGGSWDLLICKHEIERNQIYRYTIKQVRAGNNGSFMYGIGTGSIRGVNRAQDNKQFIGYYENTGNIYDRGESKKGGPKIKDGDTISIEVDTKNWKITWFLQGAREAECAIGGELRSKPIFLAIVVYNEDSQIEFL